MKYLSICFILIVGCLLGCDPVPSKRPSDIERVVQNLQPGATAVIESEEDIGESLYKHEGSASGEGSGLSTESEKVGQSFDSSSPLARLFNGSGADGGSTSIEQTLTGGSQASFLAYAAILIGLGGIPVMIWVNRRAGFAMFAFAGVLLVASMVPQFVWVIIALAGVAGAGLYIYAERKNTTATEALRATVAGIEDLDETTRKMAKSKIAAHADDRDKNTIRKIKKADDLPSERP